MDPIALGVVATSLILRSLEKLADKAGEEAATRGADVLGNMVHWLRERFSKGDGVAAAALAEVERVPDSPRLQEALAGIIAAEAKADPSFGDQLEELVERARNAGIGVSSTVQTATGNQNVQNANIQSSSIKISQAGAASPGSAVQGS